ncbi:hypothetical protein MMC13_008345 [Lambiella insularis]|nr:hypothetical protein [Lambiella insularis]
MEHLRANEMEGTTIVADEPLQHEPKSEKMEPHKTYVAVLPGHTRPVFMRKKRSYRESSFSLTAIAQALAPPVKRGLHSVEHVVRMRSPSPIYVRAYSATQPIIEHRNLSRPTAITKESVDTDFRPAHYSQPVLEEQIVSDSITTKATTHDSHVGQTLPANVDLQAIIAFIRMALVVYRDLKPAVAVFENVHHLVRRERKKYIDDAEFIARKTARGSTGAEEGDIGMPRTRQEYTWQVLRTTKP